MQRKPNPMKYFSGSTVARLPLHKLIAGGLATLMVASIGIGAMAAGVAGALPAPTPSPTPAAPTAAPTAPPTPTPTPTPEPIQLYLDVTSVQQDIGVQLYYLGEEPSDADPDASATPGASASPSATPKASATPSPSPSPQSSASPSASPADGEEAPEGEHLPLTGVEATVLVADAEDTVSEYPLDTETGTILAEDMEPGVYTVSLAPLELAGYRMPIDRVVTVEAKVVYKADIEGVKDKIVQSKDVNESTEDSSFGNGGGAPIVDEVKDTVAYAESASELVKTVYVPVLSKDGYLLLKDKTKTPYKPKYGENEELVAAVRDKVAKASATSAIGTAAIVPLGVASGRAVIVPLGVSGTASSAASDPAPQVDLAPLPAESAPASSQAASTEPSPVPTTAPTQAPTQEPAATPGTEPTAAPTEAPSATPSAAPTTAPTQAPTQAPTATPGTGPTAAPTQTPGPALTAAPTQTPAATPSATPAPTPTQTPTDEEPEGEGEGEAEIQAIADPFADWPATIEAKDLEKYGFALTEKEVYSYTGWQTQDGVSYYYDPVTHDPVTGSQVIQGTVYEFSTSGALNQTSRGIDVSKYQRDIDWNAVKADGISFAIIRVGYRGYGSEGKLVEDDKFKRNIQGATAAGLRVGVYFYSQATTEAEAVDEASMVLRLVRGYSLPMGVWFDTEKVANANGRADGISASQRTACAVAFCETIRNGGYTPGVYSYASWFYNQLNFANISKYRTWIAQYRNVLDFKYKYEIWQYTGSGHVNGVPTDVDMNLG